MCTTKTKKRKEKRKQIYRTLFFVWSFVGKVRERRYALTLIDLLYKYSARPDHGRSFCLELRRDFIFYLVRPTKSLNGRVLICRNVFYFLCPTDWTDWSVSKRRILHQQPSSPTRIREYPITHHTRIRARRDQPLSEAMLAALGCYSGAASNHKDHMYIFVHQFPLTLSELHEFV